MSMAWIIAIVVIIVAGNQSTQGKPPHALAGKHHTPSHMMLRIEPWSHRSKPIHYTLQYQGIQQMITVHVYELDEND